MKWKIYKLANILNLLSIAGFLLFICYFKFAKNAEINGPLLTVFLVGGLIFFIKGIMGLTYQKRIETQTTLMAQGKGIFNILIVLHFIAALFFCYGFYDITRHIKNEIIDLTFICGFSIITVFAFTSLVIIPLDYYMLANLKKLEDPSIGILEENMNDSAR